MNTIQAWFVTWRLHKLCHCQTVLLLSCVTAAKAAAFVARGKGYSHCHGQRAHQIRLLGCLMTDQSCLWNSHGL